MRSVLPKIILLLAISTHAWAHHAVASGPFADVPRGHWAYDAVQKSAEAGILQGWNNKFHGNRVVNRYQMAVVVARMLDRVGVLRAGGKVITAQDIANLESLVIEFADELALLNVKVSTLEDTVAGLKKDVDLIKADLRGVGARAGITGLMDARYVYTASGSPAWGGGPFTGAGAYQPPPAATAPLGRYQGQIVVGNFGDPDPAAPLASGPALFGRRGFFTVSNFALNIDREFDPHIHFHAQLNVNAEGDIDDPAGGARTNGLAFGPPDGIFTAPAPNAGRGSSFFGAAGNIMVNELYVVFDDWFGDGVNGRAGIFALPMNTEVNGPSRTYLWTLTPSISNSKWESLRPVGLDLFQQNDKDSWVFYVGFFTPGDTSNGLLRSGTLLSQATDPLGTGGFMTPGTPSFLVSTVQVDNVPTGQPPVGFGRFPTPSADAAMTDAARGVDGQSLASDDVGFYGMIGQHPTCKDHRGLTWHVAYFDRNGDIHRGSDGAPSLTDWNAWQAMLQYQWTDVALLVQYYDANSRNYTFADLGGLGLFSGPVVDGRRISSTPFVSLYGADTISQSLMALVNWQFCRRGTATVRYEHAADTTSAAKLEAEVWTFAFNWRTSDHGWLQLEWLDPTTTSTSENGVRNTADVQDGLVQLNYKLAW